eukprot:6185060-Pleurochrysis_carterae.AAC.3
MVQNGREDAPRGVELGGGDEVGLVAREHLEQQPLVRLGQLLLVARRVHEVHPHLLHLEAEAGHLVLHLPVNGLLGLQPHDQLVCRAISEGRHHAGDAVELDAHLQERTRSQAGGHRKVQP